MTRTDLDAAAARLAARQHGVLSRRQALAQGRRPPGGPAHRRGRRRRWHTRVDDVERDRRRDIDAGLLGWTVVRFVWNDLVERPEWVCHVVATHLRRAA
ncbi:MAG TPA: hypothetical protein VFJ85_04085 [Acidimicrobiales bacterium]|nr:hypothetical protein [Acidimicrobiales bacterium]